MSRSLKIVLGALLLSILHWQSPGAFAESDCERAKADYDLARQQTDLGRVVALLEDVVERCPTFNAWFVKGNAHRKLGQWSEALAAYRQAAEAGEPEQDFMAQAHGALMQHHLGRTCEAARSFQLLRARHILRARPDAPMPPWLRDLYEAFERSLAEAPMSTDEMACALKVTKDHRTFRVCPYVNVRIPFAYDRADIDANNRSTVVELAKALHQVNDGAYRYRLVGHTDSRGSADYNQSLSERRAESVRVFIAKLQLDLKDDLEARGEGEDRLLTTDDSESSHALNRRVEVQVLCL